MRLTNMTRDAFIIAVMADVPKRDFREEATKLVQSAIESETDKVAGRGTFKKLKNAGMLGTNGFDTPGQLWCNHVYSPTTRRAFIHDSLGETWEKLELLEADHATQRTMIRNLETNLRGVAYACTTLKALQDALPEFVKYIPTENAPLSKNLPALANVAADFIKAGWPKKEQV